MKIRTIDCEYVMPEFAAAFLLTQNGRAAFVETNTSHSVPKLLSALKEEGLAPEQVDYIIVTHVHLDHAGGASALMAACPNATLLAHPRAVPHLVDPAKLVGSARKVYGDAVFDQLYGQIVPIPAVRVRALNDNETLSFAGSELRFLHTRGHANHHFCVLLPSEKAIFTGDSFGLAYPALQGKGLFIFPSTSPTDFDPAEARKSVERIRSSGATRAYLTHFGPVDRLDEAARQLDGHLAVSGEILKEAVGIEDDDARAAHCLARLRAQMSATGMDPDLEVLRMDIEINAQGIAHVAKKLRSPSSGSARS